jgi:hypothetical protein
MTTIFSNAMTLSVTGGTPPTPPDPTPDPKIPNALPWYAFVCKTYGTAINASDTVLSDFTRCLVFDLGRGTIHPGYGYPLTCTMPNASPCAGNAQLPQGLFAGSVDGYVCQVFSPDSVGLGAPVRRVAWYVAADSTAQTIKVSLTQEKDFFPLEDILLGLPVLIERASGLIDEGIIASNTVDSITLKTALSSAPSVGDTLLIAPMACGVLFGERRYRYPSNLPGMLMDVENRQGQPQPVEVGLYKAAPGGNAIDLNDGAACRVKTTDASRLSRGGRVMLPRVASKALAPFISFHPRAAGMLQISGLAVLEDARNGG